MYGLVIFLLAFIIGCQPLPPGISIEQYKNQFVEGVVIIDEKLKNKIPKGKKYLIISLSDTTMPMPIAVMNVEDPTFPYKFKISEKHKIDQSRFIAGMLILKARLSKSPFAEPEKGDLVGQINVVAGTKDAQVVLSEVIE